MPSAAKRPTLIMIDGHALAYRQFFALPLESFSTHGGEPTNATFGFARTLLDILEKDRPDYLLATFDRGLSGRNQLYPDYKATRDKMPDELRIQMQRIHELVEAFNIPLLSINGYEADDLLGTLSDQAAARDLDVLIVTGDRDLLQLVTERIHVRLPAARRAGNGDQVFDPAAFREAYEGLEPPQLVDLKALMGDPSDNIPGVKGIGEKGGIKLLKAYGSLEGIFAHLAELPAGQRQKLEEGREMAFLSRELARIRHDAPVTLDLPACVAQDYDRDRVAELFRTLQFRSLIGRLAPVGEAHATPGVARQLSMFATAEEAAPAAPHTGASAAIAATVIIQDEKALANLVNRLNAASAISFDTETTSTDQMQAELVGISLSTDGETGYYIPVGHTPPPGAGQEPLLEEAALRQLSLEQVIAALRGPLTDPRIPKYGHNAKYDLIVLRRYGLDVTPIRFDTMVAEWLCDPDSRNKGLKNLAWIRLGLEMTPITDLIGSGKNQITMDRVSIPAAASYAAADAAVTFRLVAPLRAELEEKRVLKLYDDLEMPLLPVLADMEMAGIRLDTAYLAQISAELSARLAALEQEIYDQAGGYGPFNINSPKQLNDVLFGKLQLPAEGVRKTTHGLSTSADVLEDLRDLHPIVGLILEHRELTKLKGTYVDALPELVNPRTGRLHTSFNQTGTVTGRISSDNPNLQNIPVRTEQGRQIRRAFVAPEGHYLLSVDYSQVELRVLAHISQDPTLLEAFRQGQDIHRTTAATVYGIPFEAVTYDQRRFAKSVNFGLLYGMGAFRLARDSNLTLAQAEAFIQAYFERFPRVRAYLDETKRLAASQGYLETLLGRRRYFPELQASASSRASAVARQRAERQAINMPIQGTAADIMKLAMIQVQERLKAGRYPARMLLQVHDELVLEVAEDALESVTRLVIETMEGAFALDAPLRADARYGANWLDMQDFTA